MTTYSAAFDDGKQVLMWDGEVLEVFSPFASGERRVHRLTMSAIEVKQTRKGLEYWIHCAGRPRGFIAVRPEDDQARQLLDHVKAELGI